MNSDRDTRIAFWEKLGRPIQSDSINPLQQANLDWEPITASYDIKMPDGSRRPGSDFRILINSKTGSELSPCSPGWQPLGNREFFNITKRSLESLHSRITRAGYVHGANSSLKLGDRCVFFVSDEIPELGFALYDDDVEEKYSSRLFFYNHHSPGCGLGCKLIVIRKVCANGAISTGITQTIKLSHTSSGVDKYRENGSLLDKYKEIIQSKKASYQALSEVAVSDSDAMDFFATIAGDKKKSGQQQIVPRIMQSIYTGAAKDLMSDLGINLAPNDYTKGTAYGLAQAVTAYYSHFGTFNSSDSAIKSRVFNDTVKAVDNAFDSLSRLYLTGRDRKRQIIPQSVSLK